MTKDQLEIEKQKVRDNKFLPEAVKNIKIKKLDEEFAKQEAEASKKAPAKAAPAPKAEKATSKKRERDEDGKLLTSIADEPGFDAEVLAYLKKKYPHYTEKKMEGWNDEDYNDAFFEMVDDVRDEFLVENVDNEQIANGLVELYLHPPVKGSKKTKKEPTAKKPKKEKKATTERKFKGKSTKDLTDEECDELRKEVEERRKKAAKAEKRSKSKPVVEKIAANVATAVKQAIKNVPASDIKDDVKGEISKMERIEKAAKAFLVELRSILGEDYDREAIDGEFKEIHELIKGLKAKYK